MIMCQTTASPIQANDFSNQRLGCTEKPFWLSRKLASFLAIQKHLFLSALTQAATSA
jgi:hypothetical protein